MNVAKSNAAAGRGRLSRVSGSLLVAIYILAMFVSIIFVLCMLGAGLRELSKAILMFDWGNSEAGNEADLSIEFTIRALEMFIIAPLPCIVLQGVARHLSQYAGVDSEMIVRARASLPEVKATIANILVSTVAVNLVGRVLETRKGFDSEGLLGDTLNWETVGSLLLIIVVLTGYYFVMEYSARTIFAESNQTKASPPPSG